MNDKLLRMSERVEISLQIGESHFREFKSALEGPPENKKPMQWKTIATKIADTLVGFANADGGELLMGVEDDGEVTGVAFPESLGGDWVRARLSIRHRGPR